MSRSLKMLRVLFVAALVVAPASPCLSNRLASQERAGPLGTILKFVRDDVPKLAPRQLGGGEISSVLFLTVPGSPAYHVLGPLDQRSMASLGVTLVDDYSEVLLTAEGDRRVRDNGVYVMIGPIRATGEDSPRLRQGTLTIRLAYYVTLRPPGERTSIGFTSWRLVVEPPSDNEHGWRIVEAERLGIS